MPTGLSRVARLWPPLALLALACALFRDTFHRDRVPAGFDLLVHYSHEQVLRAALHERQWPFWNPLEFGGFPLWADPQTGLLYPLTVLRGLPVPTFLTITLVLHVWLFGVGGYALARALDCRRVVATIAGVGLMLGGVLLPRIYAGHVDLVRTAAWTPLILALAIRSFARDQVRPSTGLVLAFACQLLGGWLQHVIYSGAVLAAYAAFATVWPGRDEAHRRRWVPLAQYAWLAVLVAGLTAAQTLPTLELIRAGGRTGGVDYDEAIKSAVPLSRLGQELWPSPEYSLRFEGWETAAYAGLLLPCLVPLAFLDRRRRRHVVFFGLLGLIAFAAATGGPLYDLHYRLLPMFRLPGRLMPFVTLSMVVLGALGLEWLAGLMRARTAVAAVLALAGVIVGVDLWRYGQRFIQPQSVTERFQQQVPAVPPPGGRALSLCEGHTHALELVALGIRTIDGYNPYFTAGMARYASRARGETPRRFYRSFPRIGESGALPDLSRLRLMNVTDIMSCGHIQDPALQLTAESHGLLAYRVREPAGRAWPIGDDVVRCPASGTPAERSAAFTTGAYRGDRFDGRVRVNVVMPRTSGLLLSEPFYSARRAFVDGREVPVWPVFDALSAICVPAGSHAIELRYGTRAIVAGVSTSLATLALWVPVVVRSRRRRAPRPGSGAPRQPAAP